MYEHPDPECGGTEIWPDRHEYGEGWTETPLYAAPPTDEVARLTAGIGRAYAITECFKWDSDEDVFRLLGQLRDVLRPLWASTGFEAQAFAAQRSDLVEACSGIDADYMTSEQHHPGHVLIPTAKFEAIIAALGDTP